MSEVSQLSVVVKANVGGAVTSLKTVQGEMTKTGATAKKMDAAVTASASSTTKAASGYTMLGTSAAGAAKQTEKVAPAVTKTTAATSKMGAASRGAQSAVTAFGGSAMAMQGGVLLAGYALGKTVSTAVDFDAAMRNVNSIAGLSEDRFHSLSKSVQSMAGRTAQTPQTLALGLYDLVSSGFGASDALGVLEASANAATAGLTTTEVSTSAVAAVLNAYQLPAKRAGAVSDTLFKTVDRGVISFDQLAQNIGDVLPFASSLGVNLNQVGASISTMTKGGISPAETMTRIKAVMTALIQPSDQLKATMHGLGYESATSMLKAKGFQGSLDMLARTTGGSKEKLAQLFPNVRALGGVMALTGGKAKAAQSDVKSFANTVGSTQKALSQQKESTQFKFNKAKADAQSLAVTVGSVLLPMLSNAAETASGIADGLDSAGNAIDHVAGKGAGKSAFSFLTSGWNDIASEAKNMGGKIASMASQAWNGKKTTVKVGVVPKVDTSSVKSVGDMIKSAGAKGKITIPMSAKDDASPQLKSVARAAAAIDKQKADVTTHTLGYQNAIGALQLVRSQVESLDGKTANTYVKVHKSEVKDHASGGIVNTPLVRVNENGPESATDPRGRTAMLGDGREMVTALPSGWRVNTAAETRRMFGEIPHLKGGGKPTMPHRKKGEKEKDWKRRYKDYQQRYNAWVDRGSGIQDSRDDTARANIPLTTDASGQTVEDTAAIDAKNVTTAERHLAEAKKKKGAERKAAVARAQAEVAEAKKQQAIDAANQSSTQNNTAAIQAQTQALNDVKDELAKNRDFAQRASNAWQQTSNEGIKGMLSNEMGGMLTDWILTNSPRWQTI